MSAIPAGLWQRCRDWLRGRPVHRAVLRPGTSGSAEAGRAAPVQSPVDDIDDTEARLHSSLYALALYPMSQGSGAVDTALQDATSRVLQERDWSARQLPRRPQLLPQLIHSVNESDASARMIASIIGQDPVLAGNLLRIANSPAFRVQERAVDSLQRAVTLVGTDGIRQIISAVLVQPVMQVDCDVFPRFSGVIWEHALLASRAAADHARTVTGDDPFAAQWLGLTQGLGAALVMKQLQQQAAALQAGLDYPTTEAVLRQWTLPVAQRIAMAWELPQRVHETLHAPQASSGLALSLRLARAAATASLLCRHGHIGQGQAMAWLERIPGTPAHALLWIWRRLHGRAVETIGDDDHGRA